MNMNRRQAMAATACAVAVGISAVAFSLCLDGMMPTASADEEIKVVKCDAFNESDSSVYIYIDNTGRIGNGVKPDRVLGLGGIPLPPGLIIPAKSNKSFGEAVGGGDAPTFHLWLVDAEGKITEGAEHANVKVGPKPTILIPPTFEVVWTGSVFKER